MEDKKINKKEGQAMLLAVMLFMASSLLVSLGLTSSTLNGLKSGSDLQKSKESFSLGESLLEDITYRLRVNKSVSSNESLTLNNYTATSSITDVASNEKLIDVSGNVLDLVRNLKADVVSSPTASFNYGIQTGAGGITLYNGSYVNGNLYSNGQIMGIGSGSVDNAVSAGPNGYIAGLEVDQNAHANTIIGSDIGGDAYYKSKYWTNVSGTSYPNSSDMPLIDMPISDNVITDWENGAESTRVISSPCPYIINEKQTVTLGNVKINCSLFIGVNSVVNFTGTVWVSGNVYISEGARLSIDSSIAGKSVPIIADNRSNRSSSSSIFISNNKTMTGNGGYLFFISMNGLDSVGGIAISASNHVRGDLALYAPHGSIYVSSGANLAEITGYSVFLENNSAVNYQTGVASPVFVSSSPEEEYSITDWGEN